MKFPFLIGKKLNNKLTEKFLDAVRSELSLLDSASASVIIEKLYEQNFDNIVRFIACP
jgi:hypothetical protein